MIKSILLTILLLTATLFSAAQDKIDTFAHAIARTEGFYIKDSLPRRCHNPGDLTMMSKGGTYPGQVGIYKKRYIIFRNDAAGFAALRHQIEKILQGESKFYSQNMTLLQLGKFYAVKYRIWAKNLAHNLCVSPSITLEEYFELPPRVKFEIKGPPQL